MEGRFVVRLPFHDRIEAGRLLGKELAKRLSRADSPANPIVLALPRGGVPVGAEVAAALDAPLDIVAVRKLGVPDRPELAMGAIAGGRIRTLDHALIRGLRISQAEIDEVAREEAREAARQEKLFRRGRAPLDLRDRTVILVDDGLATGSTMAAAVDYARDFSPKAIVAAAPVGSDEAVERLARAAGSCVCLATPRDFHAVGEWYRDFDQVSDKEVQQLLSVGSGKPRQ